MREFPAACQERLDYHRVDHGSPCDRLAQSPEQLIHVADPFFEKVSESGRAVLEQLECVRLVRMLREHDDSNLWMARPDLMCRIDALHVVTRRHPDVGDDGVWQQAIHCVDELLRRTDCGHDLDLAGVL